jgi:hypothetical protein
MNKLVLAIALVAALVGCTDEHGSRRALEAQGFGNIEFTGYAWIGCGQDDDFATRFNATNPAGKRVSGVVCCGLAKGCTVRF